MMFVAQTFQARQVGCFSTLSRLFFWTVLVTLFSGSALAAEPGASLPPAPVFNRLATVIFGLAIAHTFLASRFMKVAHRLEHEHEGRRANDFAAGRATGKEVSFKAEVFHFLGEIEVVFGLWVVPLFIVMIAFHGWHTSVGYLDGLNFTEPLFVLVIMAIAATRPVLSFAEGAMARLAGLGRSSPGAWWLSILTAGPLLGSFITEPAAMTISALLLAAKFYARKPSPKLAYGTLGLLFVNVSIGGTLTHFAAPPVLMVAGKWGWNTPFMMTQFGWKSALAILISNLIFWLLFRKEFAGMLAKPMADQAGVAPRVPKHMVFIHLLFLAWTVITSHYPVLFLGGFLFFLGFTQATAHHQDELSLRMPLLVAFFLAGLVIHGGLQAWWIEPLLGRLSEKPLFFGAIVLTAFNDNAAITYLSSLVPTLTDAMKHAVVSGAVVGGGLTVIANAPNPAGISLLGRYFDNSVSPLGLLAGAALPTAVAAICFLLL